MDVPGVVGGLLGSGAAPGPVEGAERSAWLLSSIRDGGLISYLLIGLSVVALALVIRNLFVLRLARLAPIETARRLEDLLAEGDTAGAVALCRRGEERSYLTAVMGSALDRCRHSENGLLDLRLATEEAAQAEADELHRANDGIGIIAAVGPMLGLLGTVIGMIGAFRTIGSLEGAARSSQLATFMSMALVNTAEGLIVAIPCTVAFALFRRRIDRLLKRMSVDLERLVAAAARGAHAPGGKPPRALAGAGERAE